MYNVRFKCTYIMSAKLNKHSRLERTRGAPFGARLWRPVWIGLRAPSLWDSRDTPFGVRLGRPVWIGLGAPSFWGAKSALSEGF